MKIGFSLVDLSLGGAQIFTIQLIEGLVRKGHSVEYYLWANPNDPDRADASLIDQINKYAVRKEKAAQLNSCDVIQLDGYHNLRRKIPFLAVFPKCFEIFHSVYSIHRSGPVYTPHRIAVSKYVQQKLKFASQLIYQGVPLPNDLEDGAKFFDVAIVGRIHPVKNHKLFFDICEKLFESRGILSVLVIGYANHTDRYASSVMERIAQLMSVGIRISITGRLFYGEISRVLPQARTVLVTSRDEGFGRMAVEAMACSVPVVANPVGGLPEIVVDRENGYLANKDDVDSFTRLTNDLLQEPDLCTHMGIRGRELVRKRFSIERMVSDFETAYSEISKS